MLYTSLLIVPCEGRERRGRLQRTDAMNFMGMGWMEISVILIVALIIFGPGKLPEVAGQVGKAVRVFRRLTSVFTDEF
jgi:TatA/E family protein of Tat protein translocase